MTATTDARAPGPGGAATTTPRSPVLPSGPRSVWGAGALAGVYAVGVGYAAIAVVVLLTWAFAPDSAGGDPAGTARLAGIGWVMSHFGVVDVADVGLLRLTPIGITVAIGAGIARAGAWAAKSADIHNLREAAAVTLTLAASYTGVGLFLASIVSTDDRQALPGPLAVGAFGTALVAGGIGVLLGAGLRRAALAALPPRLRVVLVAGAAAVGVFVVGGGLLVTASLLMHADRVVDLTSALAADPLGGLTLALIGVALVPNVVIWAATFTLGTGFGLGVGTSVAPSGVDLGVLPTFPLLGALPDPGPLSSWTYTALVVPVAAGAVLGLVVNRRGRLLDPVEQVWLVVAASGLSGAALGLLALLSGGSLGDAALRQVGPHPLVTAALAVLLQVLAGAIVVWEWPRARARLARLPWRMNTSEGRPRRLDAAVTRMRTRVPSSPRLPRLWKKKGG